jgi:aromatic ring-opening dioxygenase LigB subunit
MSHRLKADGPYGFAEEGPVFDKLVVNLFSKGDLKSLMHINPETTEKAGECGLRSFIIMAGALDEAKFKPSLKSYEGTFGVGYAVASFVIE